MEYGNRIQSVSGYVTSAPAPVDIGNLPPLVCDGVGAAEQLLSAIQESISALEKRLDTVLRPVPPLGQSGPSTAASQPICSHLTGRLAILNEGFENANQRLRELTARIEA